MRNFRSLLLRYGITTAVAGAATVFILWLRSYGEATAAVARYRILADAFTVPGVLLICVAALVWVSSEGFFDGLGYAFSRVGSRLIPFFKRSLEHQTYYDYVQEKKGKRIHGYSFLFFVGLAFVAVAVVFIILHESVYVPSI